MTRLRTDQACLEAQMQAQVAQGLNAELAVPCPDCGVESGRACRGDFNREVRTHLARSVAANRRDTEPCPAPTESLERASARAFAESMRADSVWSGKGSSVACPFCKAPAGGRCHNAFTGEAYDSAHFMRIEASEQTPTAPERAPAIAPEAVASTPPRPACACGQTIWTNNLIHSPRALCSDCEQMFDREPFERSATPAPLDQRIAETKSDDATECAWSTPTSDGEGWT